MFWGFSLFGLTFVFSFCLGGEEHAGFMCGGGEGGGGEEKN